MAWRATSSHRGGSFGWLPAEITRAVPESVFNITPTLDEMIDDLRQVWKFAQRRMARWRYRGRKLYCEAIIGRLQGRS